jgi:hypothetical protein
MYLPERLKSYPMKSLYSGVLLAMVITLSLSFLVFHAIADRVQRKSIDPSFERIDELELESARGALASGGPKALKAYLTSLDRVFTGSTHYLLDAQGVDVLTGENRASCCLPLHARNGAPTRMAITSKLSGRRTGSIGSSTRACLKIGRISGRFFLTISLSSAPPSFCAGWLQWVWFRPSTESRLPLRSSGRAISPFASTPGGRMKSDNWAAHSIKWPNASNG